jgi:Fanconi anemia group M protein
MNKILTDETNLGNGKIEPSLDQYLKNSHRQVTSDKEMVTIIADVRESSSEVLKELVKCKVKVDLKTMDVGDFVVSERVAVERKTSCDFSASIIDGRLFDQAVNMKKFYEKPFFLIEGGTLYSHRNIRPVAVMGAVSSLLIDYEIPVIWTKGPTETAMLLCAMARREQLIEKRLPRIRSEKKPLRIQDEQEFVVAGLPFVEKTLAKRLLKRFGTVEDLFSASETELQTVDGIGKKKAQRIRQVITTRYEECSS